ncbi:Aquaporin-1 [Cyphellophora attinorum]|uniref:Aquaporin-1 n=1 Tax=Cyphellophora attinorum TaxID=1664694 RepID=A0A0N1HWQ7_9EURO|nr:Aquaporin-1 [Phialophora attinorum]KPI44727.1 Aquaporin-1 [Phialophora attinorum]
MDRLSSRKGLLPGLLGRRQQAGQDAAATNGRVEKMSGSTITTTGHSPLKMIPNRIRNHFVAMAGEFVGTFMFLFFAFAGTQVANTPATTSGSESTQLPQGPNPSQLLYISLAFGFSLAVNAWIFYRISGGLFNPAVTFALCLVGAVPWGRGGLVFIAQILGSMASAGVRWHKRAQGLFIEMFLTAQLILTILMLAVEKHKGTFLAPVGIGLSLFIAELAGVYYTGGSLNPARSFGPCVANKDFPGVHWIYWLGPLLGALVASGFYWFVRSLEYESANPGQDFDDLEASAFNPDEDLARPVVQPNAVAPERPVSGDGALSPTRSRRSGSGLQSPTKGLDSYMHSNQQGLGSEPYGGNAGAAQQPSSRHMTIGGDNPHHQNPETTTVEGPTTTTTTATRRF